MNRRQPPPQRRPSNRAYRKAFERLDEALERNRQTDNYERKRVEFNAIFGLVDTLQESSQHPIPE